MSTTIIRAQVAIPVPEDDTSIDVYIARPDVPEPRAVVLVCMELFGLNDHLRDVADRVARLGHVAIAPNFYHRTLPGESLPFGDSGRARGFEHLNALERPQVLADIRAVLDHAKRQAFAAPRTGCLGFSLGGHIAWLAATQFDIAATAVFYGGWITVTDIALSRPEPTVTLTPGIARHDGKLIYLAGGRDHAVSGEQCRQLAGALEAAGVRHEMVIYPEAQHGFFCELRETFDEAARDDSWERVSALFSEAL